MSPMAVFRSRLQAIKIRASFPTEAEALERIKGLADAEKWECAIEKAKASEERPIIGVMSFGYRMYGLDRLV